MHEHARGAGRATRGAPRGGRVHAERAYAPDVDPESASNEQHAAEKLAMVPPKSESIEELLLVK